MPFERKKKSRHQRIRERIADDLGQCHQFMLYLKKSIHSCTTYTNHAATQQKSANQQLFKFFFAHLLFLLVVYIYQPPPLPLIVQFEQELFGFFISNMSSDSLSITSISSTPSQRNGFSVLSPLFVPHTHTHAHISSCVFHIIRFILYSSSSYSSYYIVRRVMH